MWCFDFLEGKNGWAGKDVIVLFVGQGVKSLKGSCKISPKYHLPPRPFSKLISHFTFRWNSCKQSKQGANSCTTNQNQTPSPEGEKLHSDSGISVDSQSLQEAQSQTQTGNATAPAPSKPPVTHAGWSIRARSLGGCQNGTLRCAATSGVRKELCPPWSSPSSFISSTLNPTFEWKFCQVRKCVLQNWLSAVPFFWDGPSLWQVFFKAFSCSLDKPV